MVEDEPSLAIVVGFYNKGEVWFAGSSRAQKRLDADSIFEIGSITKAFTGILLADAAVKGVVRLDDPLENYVPSGIKTPSRNDKKILLVHLSNHHSGLPRLPSNFNPKSPDNPYVDYSTVQLFEFLNGYELTRDPGATYEYSNYAAGLLG